MTCLDIVLKWLKDHEIEGLCTEDCGCGVDDFMPCGCGSNLIQCIPAKHVRCTQEGAKEFCPFEECHECDQTLFVPLSKKELKEKGVSTECKR